MAPALIATLPFIDDSMIASADFASGRRLAATGASGSERGLSGGSGDDGRRLSLTAATVTVEFRASLALVSARAPGLVGNPATADAFEVAVVEALTAAQLDGTLDAALESTCSCYFKVTSVTSPVPSQGREYPTLHPTPSPTPLPSPSPSPMTILIKAKRSRCFGSILA